MATANRMLKKGSKGIEVKLLQGQLNQKIPLNKLPKKKNLTKDGDFGPNTDTAVRIFQQLRRLKVDGIVGKHCLFSGPPM